jgi:cytochrome c oxidase subunit 2
MSFVQSFAVGIRRRPAAALGAMALLVGAAVLAGPIQSAMAQALNVPRVVKIKAERFDFEPENVVLKKGQPTILELISKDRAHGFHVKALGVRADLMPGEQARIQIVPNKTGTFVFTCDLFCGSGHDEMAGKITVVD